MKNTILIIFTLFILTNFAKGQEIFYSDSIISDTTYIKKSGNKYYETITVIDKNYNVVTKVTEIPDLNIYLEVKEKELTEINDQISFIDTNIFNLQAYIQEQRKQKAALNKRYNRLTKQINNIKKKL